MKTNVLPVSKDEKANILQSFADLPDDALACFMLGVKFGQVLGKPPETPGTEEEK